MQINSNVLRIYFLDVGQGDCTVIWPPQDQGAPILFDCADAYVAERFFAEHGATDLGAVVASHLDIDHVRGILPFLTNHFAQGRTVQRLLMFPDRVPDPGRNQTLRELMNAALAWEKTPPHLGFVLKANFRDGEGPLVLAKGPDWQVELVLPWVASVGQSFVDGGDAPNACSAVLRVTRGGSSVLIGGDAPLGSWEGLEPALLPARVIRVPHHGGEIREGGERWTRFDQLYSEVRADLAVFSVGTNNGYNHPNPEHLEAARREGQCRLLCSQLTPRCHSAPTDLRDEAVRIASGVEWPYRHRAMLGHPKSRPRDEVPCAGSVVVWIHSDGSLEASPALGEDHDRLLARVDQPLCCP